MRVTLIIFSMLDGELIHMPKMQYLNSPLPPCLTELADLPHTAFKVSDFQEHSQNAITREILYALDG